MSDLINRQNAIEGVKELFACADVGNDECGITYMLENLPSADRLEVESATIHNEGITFSYRKTGEWIYGTDPLTGEKDCKAWTCSICGEKYPWQPNYCPNCGAKMGGESDG